MEGNLAGDLVNDFSPQQCSDIPRLGYGSISKVLPVHCACVCTFMIPSTIKSSMMRLFSKWGLALLAMLPLHTT